MAAMAASLTKFSSVISRGIKIKESGKCLRRCELVADTTSGAAAPRLLSRNLTLQITWLGKFATQTTRGHCPRSFLVDRRCAVKL